MASTNTINLSKIKKQLARKNIRTGGKLIFNTDASNKIFQLCKTANQKFLILSFQNNPSEFLKYIRADKVLESQGLLTPRILEENKSLKYLLMDYYPTNNSSKYFKREEIKIKRKLFIFFYFFNLFLKKFKIFLKKSVILASFFKER